MTLTITIPGTPDTCLRPNSTKHRMTKGRHRARLKRDAYYATRHDWSHVGDDADFTRATVRIEIYWEKGRQLQDADGALSLMKGGIDGIAAALGVADKEWRFEPVEQYRDPDGKGFVRVEVEDR